MKRKLIRFDELVQLVGHPKEIDVIGLLAEARGAGVTYAAIGAVSGTDPSSLRQLMRRKSGRNIMHGYRLVETLLRIRQLSNDRPV